MKKILYIEDNPDTSEAVKLILTAAGFDIKTSLTGKEGLALISKEQFDLLLLDIMLPDMSGWDIYHEVKGKIKSKYVFLSAIPVSTERMQELIKEGISDYITKPFEKKDLITRINKIIPNNAN